MRELMFRGKRKDDGKWTYGYLFKIWEQAYILWGTTNGVPNMIEVGPETVGQQTGLKDRNGKEVYEGDIVTHEVIGRMNDTHDKGVVSIHPTQGVKVGNWPSGLDIEVIGNIYESKEE